MASPDKKAFLLRIDPALWAEIERLAAAELRSVNAQVEYLLRDALKSRGMAGKAPPPGLAPSSWRKGLGKERP
ncbi:MAG: hypothetical protein ABIO71_05680 [Caldimonas sp.]